MTLLESFNEEYISRVKEIIANQPIPPHYNPDEWKVKRANCYAYALRACMNFGYYDVIPGFISGCKFTEHNLLQCLEEDCKSLGLQLIPTTVEEEIGANEYKIVVYTGKGIDPFHFARQDDDGRWSHKDGCNGEIQILESPENMNGYEFIGVFRVSKKTV